MTNARCIVAFRRSTWLVLFACVVIILFAYYEEYVEGRLPCALCSMQRWMMVAVACLLLLGVLMQAKHLVVAYALAGLQWLLSLMGLLVASRQWWLQWHPHSVEACLPGLKTLLASMPWHQALQLSWQGSTSCGDVIWRMWGINVVVWSMLVFMALMVHAVLQIMVARCLRAPAP